MKKSERIKELEMQVSCLEVLLAEYVVKEAVMRIPIPDYANGCKENNKVSCIDGRFLGMIPFQYLSEKQKQAKEQ